MVFVSYSHCPLILHFAIFSLSYFECHFIYSAEFFSSFTVVVAFLIIFTFHKAYCQQIGMMIISFCLPSRYPVNIISIIYHMISYHIISYIISYHIISYRISYHIISYIMSYHIISCHISYHIISYHIISYHIISYHIISYSIIYHIQIYFLLSILGHQLCFLYLAHALHFPILLIRLLLHLR